LSWLDVSNTSRVHRVPPLPFDAVVMLTSSDWRTEMRSNRFHYASRFARDCPVYFVQPDRHRFRCSLEATEIPGVTIVHASKMYSRRQSLAIEAALRSRNIRRPLVWIYNHQYGDLIRNLSAALKVYHATEDYFYEDVYPSVDRGELRDVLQECDLIVAVSEGVRRDFQELGRFEKLTCVLNNGCDFQFWSDVAPRRVQRAASGSDRIALFQGGINGRLDFALLRAVADRLKDWTIVLCGPDSTQIDGSVELWRSLQSANNVKYWGTLSPDKLKEAMSRATVGLIPFTMHPIFREVSRPLKSFEYLACGLPVVSIPIDSLQPYGALFRFASTPEQWVREILAAEATAYDALEVQRRVEAARQENYDHRYAELSDILGKALAARSQEAPPENQMLQEWQPAASDSRTYSLQHVPDLLLGILDRLPHALRPIYIKSLLLSKQWLGLFSGE
jgi:glycosyltransferase involved in cell wall biosynthesis